MNAVRTASLDWRKNQCFSSCIGQLLDRLIHGSPAFSVKPERDGFTLVGNPDRLDEFSDLVREAADHAGDDFVVFTTSDGGHRYSQMFVLPLDKIDAGACGILE